MKVPSLFMAVVERRSLASLLLPTYSRASSSALAFRSPYTGVENEVLDLNQNAGCVIFGHNSAGALEAIDAVLKDGTPVHCARCGHTRL